MSPHTTPLIPSTPALPVDGITVPLYRLAHGRTGDKGNRSCISIIAHRPEWWPLLVAQVTPERVAQHFAARRPTQVQRYVLPQLAAMNWVLDDILDGGVNDALNLDSHGKTLSSWLLCLTLTLSPEQAAQLPSR